MAKVESAAQALELLNGVQTALYAIRDDTIASPTIKEARGLAHTVTQMEDAMSWLRDEAAKE